MAVVYIDCCGSNFAQLPQIPKVLTFVQMRVGQLLKS